jgi:hypothetical protein
MSLLKRGAMAAGFPTEHWTLSRVALLIKRRFGVRYNANYLAEPLHRLGFSPQHPVTQARERDEELVSAWLLQDWPRIKRGLKSVALSSSSSTKPDIPSGRALREPGLPLGLLQS